MPKKPKTKKIKDTDYLTISACIRGMENTLRTGTRWSSSWRPTPMRRSPASCRSTAIRPSPWQDPEELDEAFSNVRRNIWKDLEQSMPDPRYLDVFRMKYDYHNVKAVLKAEAMHTSPDSMLSDLGRIPAEEVKRYVSSRGTEGELPPILAEASGGPAVLESTRDPQLCDMVLDRARFQEELRVAEITGSRFLQGYVRDCIDAANLQTLVRCLRSARARSSWPRPSSRAGDISTDVLLHVEAGTAAPLPPSHQTPGLQSCGGGQQREGL